MDRLRGWLSSLALFLTVTGAEASGPLEEMTVVAYLEETIPLELARYGSRVEVLDSEQIRLAGFNDVGQSLQMLVPGLYLAPKNGIFDYVRCSLQGSRCEDILWLVDGVRVNNRLYNTTSPLDTIPAHMVERIEVLYGGQGIFYGTQSVAGVVNVVTKSFSGVPEGSVHLGAHDNKGTNVAADFRFGVGRHQVVVYGSLDEADGFQPFRDADYQPSGTHRRRGYDVATAGLRYGLELSESTRLTLLYHHADNKVDWAAPANRARSFNERKEDLLTLKLDYRLGDNVELFLKGYYHSWDTDWTRVDNELDADGVLTGGLVVVSDKEYWGYEDYGATGMIRMAGGRGLQYTVGYDHQRYSGRDDVLLIADRTEKINAVFAQVATTADLWSRSTLALGVRHNRPSGEGNITVWNVSGRHDFGSGWFLRGTLGSSFRAPDAWQLYGIDPCCALGNPNLEGEKSRNVNLGVGGRIDVARGLAWELIGYARRVDDLIGVADGVRVNTDQTVEMTGVELAATVAVTNRLSVNASHLHSRSEAKGSDEQIVGVPKSLTKAGLLLMGDEAPYEVSVSLVRVGDLYEAVAGGIGRVEHGNYTVVDVGAAWFLDAGRSHRLSARLENVTDRRYASSLGRAFRDADGASYPYANLGTPRTWHVGYSYHF